MDDCVYPKCATCDRNTEDVCVDIMLIKLKQEQFRLGIGGFTDVGLSAQLKRIKKLKDILRKGGKVKATFVCKKCGKTTSVLDRIPCPACDGDFCEDCYSTKMHGGCCAHQ